MAGILLPVEKGHRKVTFFSYFTIGAKSAGRRHAESDGKETVPQGTNHVFFLALLGFGATAAIMA